MKQKQHVNITSPKNISTLRHFLNHSSSINSIRKATDTLAKVTGQQLTIERSWSNLGRSTSKRIETEPTPSKDIETPTSKTYRKLKHDRNYDSTYNIGKLPRLGSSGQEKLTTGRAFRSKDDIQGDRGDSNHGDVEFGEHMKTMETILKYLKTPKPQDNGILPINIKHGEQEQVNSSNQNNMAATWYNVDSSKNIASFPFTKSFSGKKDQAGAKGEDIKSGIRDFEEEGELSYSDILLKATAKFKRACDKIPTFDNISSRETLKKQVSFYTILSEEIGSKLYDRAILMPNDFTGIFIAMTELFSSFTKTCETMDRELTKEGRELEKLRSRIDNLTKDCDGLNREKLSMIKTKDQDLERAKKEATQHAWKAFNKDHENFNPLEKSKLLAQIESLASKIQAYENDSTVVALKTELEKVRTATSELVKRLEISNEDKSVKIARHEFVEANLKSTVLKLEEDNKVLRNEKHLLETELAVVSSELSENREVFHMFQEQAAMAGEEIEALKIMKSKTAEYMELVKKKFAESQTRLSELVKMQGSQVTDDRGHQHEVFLLQTVRQTFKNLFVYIRRKKSVKAGNPKSGSKGTNNDLYSGTKMDLSAQPNPHMESHEEDISLEKNVLYKPSFFIFCEHKYSDFMTTYDGNQSLGKLGALEYMMTIRGIFDSKFNEFFLVDDVRLVSSFPDFVYSWTTKFKVDPLSQKIITSTLSDIEMATNRRLGLLLFIQNPKAVKLWEVVTFKEFLEDGASDEIFFYLYCRFLLFRGSQLNYIQSVTNLINYVRIERVESVLSTILKRFDESTVDKIVMRIRERLVRKPKVELVDAGFVLRILLEFYKREKAEKYKLIKDLFQKCPKKTTNQRGGDKVHENILTSPGRSSKSPSLASPNTGGPGSGPTLDVPKEVTQLGQSKSSKGYSVSFESFRLVMEEAFPRGGISQLEIAELFRNSWNIGEGNVNHDSFWTAANEVNFFVRQLKVSFYPLKSKKQGTNDFEKECESVLQHYTSLPEVFMRIPKTLTGMGQEKMLEVYSHAEEIFTNKFLKITPEDLGGRSVTGFYLNFLKTGMKILEVELFKESLLPTPFVENATWMMDNITMKGKMLGTIVVYEKQKETIRKLYDDKVRKLQRYLRHKIGKWSSLIHDLVNIKNTRAAVAFIKKGPKQQPKQKKTKP